MRKKVKKKSIDQLLSVAMCATLDRNIRTRRLKQHFIFTQQIQELSLFSSQKLHKPSSYLNSTKTLIMIFLIYIFTLI